MLQAGAVSRRLLPRPGQTAISHTSPVPWCPLLKRRQDSQQRHMLGALGRFSDEFLLLFMELTVGPPWT